VVGFIPVLAPSNWNRIDDRETETTYAEAATASANLKIDAERMARAKEITEPFVRNVEASITTTLRPSVVITGPIARTWQDFFECSWTWRHMAGQFRCLSFCSAIIDVPGDVLTIIERRCVDLTISRYMLHSMLSVLHCVCCINGSLRSIHGVNRSLGGVCSIQSLLRILRSINCLLCSHGIVYPTAVLC